MSYNQTPVDYFTFEPNWVQTVRYGGRYATSILTGLTGHEQRSMLWKVQRRKIAYQLAVWTPDAQANLRRRIWKRMNSLWGMPVWVDGDKTWSESLAGQNVVELTDVTNKDFFPGDRLLLYKDYKSFEVATIQSIYDNWVVTLTSNLTRSWPQGTMVYPVFSFLFTTNLQTELLTVEDFDTVIDVDEIWLQSTSSSSSSSSSSNAAFSSSSSSSSSCSSSSSSSFSSSSFSSSSSSSSESTFSQQNTCFPAGSLVLMADGSMKEIETIKVGDFVQGVFGKERVIAIDTPILGDRKMMMFEDGSCIWSEEHLFWTNGEGGEWWWSVNPNRWRAEVEDGDVVGLLDNYSVRCGNNYKFAHLSGWVSKKVVEAIGYNKHTKLYLPITNGSPIIVNGYVVAASANEYKFEYYKINWDVDRVGIHGNL